MEVELCCVGDEERELHGRHELVRMDWGMGLSAGSQGQVLKLGRASNAFLVGTVDSAAFLEWLLSDI